MSLVPASAEARVGGYDWPALLAELDGNGCAILPTLLSPEECSAIAALYPDERHFRSHVHMARHGFGRGEYRYFRYPLPDPVFALRSSSRVPDVLVNLPRQTEMPMWENSKLGCVWSLSMV